MDLFHYFGLNHTADGVKKPNDKHFLWDGSSFGTTFTVHTSTWPAIRVNWRQPMMMTLQKLLIALSCCFFFGRKQWRFHCRRKTTTHLLCAHFLSALLIRSDFPSVMTIMAGQAGIMLLLTLDRDSPSRRYPLAIQICIFSIYTYHLSSSTYIYYQWYVRFYSGISYSSYCLGKAQR